MYFTHRPLREKDLASCFDMLPDKRLYGPVRGKLLDLWKKLLKEGTCIHAVVEDRRLPAPRRQAAFGFSYFASDDFCEQAKRSLPPYLALSLLEKTRGGQSPLPAKKEVDRANSGPGVNILALHYGWDAERLSPEECLKARAMLQECFLREHSGYRIKEIFHETPGPELRDFLINGGSSVRRDYKELAGSDFLKATTPQNHPYLMACTEEEARQKPGSMMSLLFHRISRPRFRFNAGERKTLEKALLGEKDEEIAVSLKVSPWTVKKRWQTIYQKVTSVDAELIETSPGPAPEDGEGRQKRRRLLEYLRVHPEEFRLGAADRRGKGKK